MPGEDRGDECTAPEAARHGPEEQEKQSAVSAMKGHIYKMVWTGIYAKKLAIEHMGDPGHGMPICGMRVDETPHQAVGSNPALDGGILGNVLRIIVQDEVVMPHRPINGQRYEDENQAQKPGTVIVARLTHEIAR